MTTATPSRTAAGSDTDRGVLLADAMSLNAITSAVTGTALLLGAPWLHEPLGAPSWVLAALGLGLVVFAAEIVAALAQPQRLRLMARFVVAADIAWVVAAGSVIVADLLTPLGATLLAMISVVVAGFAVSQAIGLRRARGDDAIGIRPVELQATQEVAADPADVWALVADAGGYDAFAPGIRQTTTDGELVVGMARSCVDDAGRTWSERCAMVDPGRGYRMEVDTSSYPLRYRLVLQEFGMSWRVTPTTHGSRLDLSFSGFAKLGVIGRLAIWVLGRDDPAEEILDRYVQHLTSTM